MKYLRAALDKIIKEDSGRFPRAGDTVGRMLDSPDRLEKDESTDNKGHFGGRSVSFKQDVYSIPERPSGDHTQPVGLLTQSDLNNYVIFRKNDRLAFQYATGSAGNCEYRYKKNGTNDYIDDIAFTDAVIQELIDDGACELI